jgi:hypothetical protein
MITVKELLDAVRTAEEAPSLAAETLPREPEIETLLARLDEAVDKSLSGRTLRDLALSSVQPIQSPAAAH